MCLSFGSALATKMFVYIILIVLHKISVQQASGCGSVLPGSRIVGGEITGGLRYPWFALLRLNVAGDPPVCAGTLISPNYILTAAHCFTVRPGVPNEDLFTVALGVYNRCSPFETTREIFNVTRVFVHERYSSSKKFFDIALMVLDRPANAEVACLPPPEDPTTPIPGTIIGFGVMRQGSRVQPCRQRQARVTRYTHQQCAETRLPREDAIEPTVFCGGAPGIDSCQGDSGGPFMTQSGDGSFIVSGIVSYGYGCGNDKLPGIYTNVASYLNWISEKLSFSTENSHRPSQDTIKPDVGNHIRINYNRNSSPGNFKTTIHFPGESKVFGRVSSSDVTSDLKIVHNFSPIVDNFRSVVADHVPGLTFYGNNEGTMKRPSSGFSDSISFPGTKR